MCRADIDERDKGLLGMVLFLTRHGRIDYAAVLDFDLDEATEHIEALNTLISKEYPEERLMSL